jgi:hypothetical protein
LLFDELLWGFSLAAGAPSSASLLIRFMIVGTNFVDKEMSPGSWKQKKNEDIRLP